MNDVTGRKPTHGVKAQKPETVAAQGLGWIDEKSRGLVPGVQVATTYVRNPDNTYVDNRTYSRTSHTGCLQPEAILKELERGAAAMLFSSGMAAATACFLALRPGDHVVAPKIIYFELRKWLTDAATQWGLNIDLVDMSNLDELRRAVKPGKTKLVWAETPANPLWDITDIAGAAEIAHAAGARFAVDSTIASPVLTRPLALGADIVMHSATKYLNGHSDVLAGVLVTKAEDEYWERIRTVRTQVGGVLGGFEAWLLVRGLRTLYPRVKTQVANAQALAERFAKHPNIVKVLYPGLPDFPGHAVAKRQMQGGFGGMMSIRVKGGEAAAVKTAANVKIWKRATSLGSVESLIEHRASLEGPGTPVPADLLRLSVGIEDADDLYDDMDQALAAAHR
ncbi:MAG: trans-sulfuration enzyme family protein [Alphaproteobacteria bacterium]